MDVKNLEIKITEKSSGDDGWIFAVSVSDGDGETTHTVRVDREDCERLVRATEKSTKDLVRDSFEFLLARESQEAILPEFNLIDIGRYFPSYEKEISGG